MLSSTLHNSRLVHQLCGNHEHEIQCPTSGQWGQHNGRRKKPHLGDLIGDVEVALGKKIQNGKDLIDPHKEKLIHLLKLHLDVFIEDMNDLPSVDLSIISRLSWR